MGKLAKCQTCSKEFSYYPSNRRGKFCSNKCRVNHPDYINPMKNKKREDLARYNKLVKPLYKKENNPNWKGGVSSENRCIRGNGKYKEWRLQVLKRDNFKCRLCGSCMNLEVHHIVAVCELPECAFEVENGMTFCKYCHAKIDKRRRLKHD